MLRTPANAVNDQTTKFSGRRQAAANRKFHSLMDDCTGCLGLAQANLDFGFRIGDSRIPMPNVAEQEKKKSREFLSQTPPVFDTLVL
ncbi:hypothetical protein [Thermoleptolyngbya sp.]